MSEIVDEAVQREGVAGSDVAVARGHWTRSPAAKVGGVLGLLVAMLIPQSLTSGLIHERENRQADVLATFRNGWGPKQVVSGPALMVPYTYGPNLTQAGQVKGWLQLPPSSLTVTAELDPQVRRRGLFRAIIYSAALKMSGVVTVPALSDVGQNPIDWASARVVVRASDLRGLKPDQTLTWSNTTAAVQPSSADGCRPAIMSVPAGLTGAPSPGTVIPFEAALTLRGTQALHVAPIARQTSMHAISTWPTPAFNGVNLPISYETGASGFDANWEVAGDPAQAGWRLLPACWATYDQPDAGTAPGVELQEAVPTYAMVDRAAKYGLFFLALAYLTLFLFEALSRVRVHLVQYGLVGLSVSLFALLLISIAEPLGFAVAYAISAAAVILQASLYTLSVVRRAELAGIFAGVLGGLFAFIYVVLSLDSYALLAGTVALFAILSVLMAVTRRVNWAAA